MPGVLTVRDEGGALCHVFKERAVIGRDPDCDVRLASRSVSRRHASVEKTPNGWIVRDLGSANGTRVSGARVTEAPLVSGAAVMFGEVEAVFTVEAREPTGAGRLLSSLSVPPARKARPVAVFIATTAGILVLAAATIWARWCDRAPTKASSVAPAPDVSGS